MMGVDTNVWGEKVHGKSPYMPLSVAVILKFALKNNSMLLKLHFVTRS